MKPKMSIIQIKVEMTFPSNFKLFYENQIRSVPGLIYKRANTKMIDLNPNSNGTHWQMYLNPVHKWVPKLANTIYFSIIDSFRVKYLPRAISMNTLTNCLLTDCRIITTQCPRFKN